ncbi:MAG: putative spermidine/putrescine transport system ATP-binding protein [Cellvibrionaceae bacterium]|jgi:putative spermidine/putrescine transport system ATP-binding protein
MTNNKTSTGPAPVNIQGLAKHYGDIKANDNVNLDIEGGEFMTLLGPSGSGKTTTLKMVAGFVEPTAGTVMIDNNVVNEPPHKRDIGMVFQNYALFPHMTAAQNVAFPLRMRRVPNQERAERVKNALAMVDLADRMDQLPRQLSGGQQQRVALARALVFEPRVVLMDEPLGALDKKLRENLQLQIRAIQQNLDITMIYVTHDQEEALVMSDRIAVFNQGKIVQVGTGEALYERPESRFVADFIGESNIFGGRLDADGSHLSSQDMAFAVPSSSLPSNGPAALVVRPERMRLNQLGTDVAGSNSIEVTVKDIIYLGSERKYELEYANGTALIARHQVGRSNITPAIGEHILASWQVEHGIVVTDEG